jgi:hypothetical protein
MAPVAIPPAAAVVVAVPGGMAVKKSMNHVAILKDISR